MLLADDTSDELEATAFSREATSKGATGAEGACARAVLPIPASATPLPESEPLVEGERWPPDFDPEWRALANCELFEWPLDELDP